MYGRTTCKFKLQPPGTKFSTQVRPYLGPEIYTLIIATLGQVDPVLVYTAVPYSSTDTAPAAPAAAPRPAGRGRHGVGASAVH
eukprot:SAG31_NODE_639_length_13309_cov_4.008468_2_plen_83_part_00